MQCHKLFTSLGLLLILLNCKLQAEEYGSISTSRPGASNPTTSVPSGLFQFECGTNLFTGPGMDTTFTIPIQLRMGVYKNIELQVAYASKYLTLGILYGGISFFDGFENSIILTTSLTENIDSLTEYSAYLPVSYSFNNGFLVLGQTALTVINVNDSDPVISYLLAAGNRLGEKNSWFIEAYQSRTIGEDNKTIALVEGSEELESEIQTESTEANNKYPPFSIGYGFTYLSGNNVQFDISLGVLFGKDDRKYKESSRFIEWGFSFRLPY